MGTYSGMSSGYRSILFKNLAKEIQERDKYRSGEKKASGPPLCPTCGKKIYASSLNGGCVCPDDTK